MYPVFEKIMGDAMISKTCALFLSDVDIKPGLIQSGGYITRGGNHIVHLTNERDYRRYRSITMRKTSAKEALIRRSANASRACLMVKYNGLHYHENQTGRTRLTILKQSAPEAALAAIACKELHLLDIIDMSHLKPIWPVRSNPLLESAKNIRKTITVENSNRYRAQKIEVPAIEFTFVDDWSRENWRYWNPVTGYASSISDPDPRQKHGSED